MKGRPKTFFGSGAAAVLEGLLRRLEAHRVFLVTGNASYVASGAEAALSSALCGRTVVRFHDFRANPQLPDVRRAISSFRAGFDVVVAVGGGSAMDLAKLVNVLAVQPGDAEDVIRGRVPIVSEGGPLICLPTTAGSGSEATHFAVVYIDGVKYSLAHQGLLPTAALVDPVLCWSLTSRATAVTGMDALAQAIESYWCVNSTKQSKRWAAHAIRLILANLPQAVRGPSPEVRAAMACAANLAGRAINVTKTTGAHALSYPLTMHFGVPHGHAVALSLSEFFLFNAGVTGEDVADPRGVDYVRRTLRELTGLLGCTSEHTCAERIRALLIEVGLETRLSELGIDGQSARDVVAAHVNAERLSNNPRTMDSDRVRALVDSIS